MFKFLRKYSVWILGFGGSLLLIAFLAPNVVQQLAQRAGYAGSVQATVGDGEKVGYDQWQQNIAESQVIDQLVTSIPGIGPVESTSHWFLLCREADLAGLTPPLEAVASNAQTILNIAANTGTRPQLVLEALAHLQGIEQLVRMYQSAGRFSDRRLFQAADELLSSATIETVVITAIHQEGITFSDEAMQAQLDTWGDTPAGSGDHGFGYKLPHRFKIEWLHIPSESIAQATKQSDEFSTREQRKFWRRNENDPSFPAVSSSISIPEVVSNAFLEKLTNQTRTRITRTLSEQLRTPKRGIEELNGFLVLPDDWESKKAQLEQVASSLQQELGIALPEYGAVATWTTLDDANTIPVIGALQAKNLGSLPISFQTLIASTKEFNSDGLQRIQEGVSSPVLETADGALFVFRITDTDPSRKPHNLEEVRSDVVRDLGRIAHWALLLKEADTIEQLARSGSVLTAAIKYNTSVNSPLPVSMVDTGVPMILDSATRRILLSQGIVQRISAGVQIQDMVSKIPTLEMTDAAMIQTIIDRAASLSIDTPLPSVPVEDRIFVVPSYNNMALVLVSITNTAPASKELAADFSGGTSSILQTMIIFNELGGVNEIAEAFSFATLEKRHNFKRGKRDVEVEEDEANIETASVN